MGIFTNFMKIKYVDTRDIVHKGRLVTLITETHDVRTVRRVTAA